MTQSQQKFASILTDTPCNKGNKVGIIFNGAKTVESKSEEIIQQLFFFYLADVQPLLLDFQGS